MATRNKCIIPYNFNIDNNGNIKFTDNLGNISIDYTGKIADTFNYPYTVKITANYNNQTGEGTFKFKNASNCDAAFYKYVLLKSKFDKKEETIFIKQ